MMSCGIELVLISILMAIFGKWIERNNYNQESNCSKKKKWWPKVKEKFNMKIEITTKNWNEKRIWDQN
jgi:cellulose synthase/poly-beta-1,6-N-acetylglucosamine synthase-like glycosyltransferase